MTGVLDRIAAGVLSDAMPVRSRVFLALVIYANREGDAWPSMPTLAKLVRTERRVVQRALRELEDAGLVFCRHRGKGGRGGGTSTYRVAPGAHEGLFNEALKGDCPDRSCEGEKGGPDSHPLPQKGDQGGHGLDPERATKSDQKGDQIVPKGRPPEPPDQYLTHKEPHSGDRPGRPFESEGEGLAARVGELVRLIEGHGLRIAGNPFVFRSRLLRACEEGLGEEELRGLLRRVSTGQNPMGALAKLLEQPFDWRKAFDERVPKHASSSGARAAGDVLGEVADGC